MEFPGDKPKASEVTVGSYRLDARIGKGVSGVVHKAMHVSTHDVVAIKRINLNDVPEDDLQDLLMEIKLMSNFDHPNVVKYLDAIHEKNHLNIVLEYMHHGSLARMMTNLRGKGFKVTESLVAAYTYQIVKGLKYLHDKEIVHRDIKGANILSGKDGQVKLADFGVSLTQENNNSSDFSVVGTPYWMAPEIIEMTGQMGPACDIWSVGCTVLELLTGSPPYFDLDQLPAMFRIVQDAKPPYPKGISKKLKSFLDRCFHKDPTKRADAEELLGHPWIANAKSVPAHSGQDPPANDPQTDANNNVSSPESDDNKATIEPVATDDNCVPVPTVDDSVRQSKLYRKQQKRLLKLLLAMGYNRAYSVAALDTVDCRLPAALELVFRWMDKRPFSGWGRPADTNKGKSKRSKEAQDRADARRRAKSAGRVLHRRVPREFSSSSNNSRRRQGGHRETRQSGHREISNNSTSSNRTTGSKVQSDDFDDTASMTSTNSVASAGRASRRANKNKSKSRIPVMSKTPPGSVKGIEREKSTSYYKGSSLRSRSSKRRAQYGLSGPRSVSSEPSRSGTLQERKKAMARARRAKSRQAAKAIEAATSAAALAMAKKVQKNFAHARHHTPPAQSRKARHLPHSASMPAQSSARLAADSTSSEEQADDELEVRVVYRGREKALGFVECSTNATLRELRASIREELDHVPASFAFLARAVAVNSHNENKLKVDQVAKGNVVRIRPTKTNRSLERASLLVDLAGPTSSSQNSPLSMSLRAIHDVYSSEDEVSPNPRKARPSSRHFFSKVINPSPSMGVRRLPATDENDTGDDADLL